MQRAERLAFHASPSGCECLARQRSLEVRSANAWPPGGNPTAGAISRQRSRSAISRGTASRAQPVQVQIPPRLPFFEPEALIAKHPPLKRTRGVQVVTGSPIFPAARYGILRKL